MFPGEKFPLDCSFFQDTSATNFPLGDFTYTCARAHTHIKRVRNRVLCKDVPNLTSSTRRSNPFSRFKSAFFRPRYSPWRIQVRHSSCNERSSLRTRDPSVSLRLGLGTHPSVPTGAGRNSALWYLAIDASTCAKWAFCDTRTCEQTEDSYFNYIERPRTTRISFPLSLPFLSLFLSFFLPFSRSHLRILWSLRRQVFLR